VALSVATLIERGHADLLQVSVVVRDQPGAASATFHRVVGAEVVEGEAVLIIAEGEVEAVEHVGIKLNI
jgi:hypothetical protein